MAMIEHRLGHATEAGEQLAHARERLDQHREQANATDSLFDDGWFEYDHFYREAESLVAPTTR